MYKENKGGRWAHCDHVPDRSTESKTHCVTSLSHSLSKMMGTITPKETAMGGECHNCILVMSNFAGHSGPQPTTNSTIMVQELWLPTLCTFTNGELTKCSSSTTAILDLIQCTLKFSWFSRWFSWSSDGM